MATICPHILGIINHSHLDMGLWPLVVDVSPFSQSKAEVYVQLCNYAESLLCHLYALVLQGRVKHACPQLYGPYPDDKHLISNSIVMVNALLAFFSICIVNQPLMFASCCLSIDQVWELNSLSHPYTAASGEEPKMMWWMAQITQAQIKVIFISSCGTEHIAQCTIKGFQHSVCLQIPDLTHVQHQIDHIAMI